MPPRSAAWSDRVDVMEPLGPITASVAPRLPAQPTSGVVYCARFACQSADTAHLWGSLMFCRSCGKRFEWAG